MPFRTYQIDPTGDHPAGDPHGDIPDGIVLLVRADNGDVEVWIRAIDDSDTGYYIGDVDSLVGESGFPLLDPSTVFHSRVQPGDLLCTPATGETPSGKLAVLVRSTL